MTTHGKSEVANLAWKDVAEVVRCLPFQYIDPKDASTLYRRFYSRRESTETKQRRAYTRHGSRESFMKHKRARMYGLTGAELEQMERERDYKCDICHGPQLRTMVGKQVHLDVDHHHGSGRVRGLLCNACNRMLAAAKDRPEVLRDAAAYLESHIDPA